MRYSDLLLILVIPFSIGTICAQSGKADFWDLPPINYSSTAPNDALAKLSKALGSGEEKVTAETPLGRLEYVLEKLDVPIESQVLVFSKTSLQNRLIHPKNPRALYFSENAYVGYVPGGHIEAIVQDPVLGPVFYLIESGVEKGLAITRDDSGCLSCHATGRTEDVPGLMVRSVFPDSDGHPLLNMGTFDVDDTTPLEERWGGWYVTGNSAMPHLGNRVFTEDQNVKASDKSFADLSGMIDVKKFPVPTSDVVCLLVLEHQCRAHTLMNAASMNYRKAYHLGQAFDPEGDPNDGSAGRVAENWADQIIDCLFFKDEADLGDGAEGSAAFQKAFTGRFPKTEDGETLAEFRLYGRIFKNRCSYMVYSDAFRGLPDFVKQKVFAKMKTGLERGEGGFEWIGGSEKKRIKKILSETLEGW